MATPRRDPGPATLLGRAELVDRLQRWATDRPDHIALVEAGGDVVTYAQLRAAVAGAHRQLRQQGAEPGSVFGLTVRNSRAAVAALLALATTAATPIVYDAAGTLTERRRVADLTGLQRWIEPAVADGGPERLPAPPASGPDELAMVTSGTNGFPKVVAKHWSATVDNSVRFADMAGYHAGDRVLCTTPLHHAFAFGVVLLPAVYAGATIVLAPHPMPPGGLAAEVARSEATVLQSVPFVYRAGLPYFPPGRGHRLRLCVSAGEPLPAELREAWRQTTGVPLRDQYGATEIGQIGFAAGDDGRTRLVPGVRAGVLAGGEIVSGEGELFVRAGPASRYLGQPELTGSVFRDGWFRSGDWGTVTTDGVVSISGRMSRRISVGGRKVDPVEVERAVESIAGVRECVVAVSPDHDGSGFVAFVAAAEGLSELALRRDLAGRLSPYKVPTRFFLRRQLPRTASGKIRMAALWQSVRSSTSEDSDE